MRRIITFILLTAGLAAAGAPYTEPTYNQVERLIGAAGGKPVASTVYTRPTYSQVERLIKTVKDGGSGGGITNLDDIVAKAVASNGTVRALVQATNDLTAAAADLAETKLDDDREAMTGSEAFTGAVATVSYTKEAADARFVRKAGLGVDVYGGGFSVKPAEGVVGGMTTVYRNRGIDLKTSGRTVMSFELPGQSGTFALTSDIKDTIAPTNAWFAKGVPADALATGEALDRKYELPAGGLPTNDLSQAALDALALAGTAVQPAAISDMETRTHADETYQPKGSYVTEETDPHVPEWAKTETKPTYTAAEVHALPDDTVIPAKVSDLPNDAGFVTKDVTNDLSLVVAGKQDAVSDLADIREGASKGATAVQPEAIADMETKTDAANTYQAKGDYALRSELPPTVTEGTVTGWGFTKNEGTVTGVKLNGSTVSGTGVVDLGAESDPQFAGWRGSEDFTNEVLGVTVEGLRPEVLAEVYSAATNACVSLGIDPSLIPQGGTLGTVGGLLLALAAAVALLNRKTKLLKSDGTAEDDFARDILGKQVAKEPDKFVSTTDRANWNGKADASALRYALSTTSSATMADRTVNLLTMIQNETLVFPTAIQGKARDFLLKLTYFTGTMELPQGVTKVGDELSFTAQKTYLIAFTEIAADKFYIRSIDITEAQA